jgi:hypothetical protein
MTFNKRVDRLESGPNNPKSPNDEVIWVDTDNNTINRYNESNSSWVSVGGTGGTGGAANTGDITFVGSTIIGNGTIDLVPDNTLNNDSYLIVTPTDTNHIHIRAGGPSDDSNADLILGGELTNVYISDGLEAVILSSASGQYLNSPFDPNNQIATIGDLENISLPSPTTQTGFRNKIINGDFKINQRDYNSGSTLASGSYGFP